MRSKIHITIENLLNKYNIDFTSEKVCSFNKFNNYLGREYN